MPKIAIVDYGLGNLRSIRKGLERAGAEAIVTNEVHRIAEVDAIVLPGVGAFEEALRNIKPLIPMIFQGIEGGKALLGICLGMQLLFTESTEGGLHRGLNIFKGRILPLPEGRKVPQIGWNTLKILKPKNPLVKGIENGSYVYFAHSYFAKNEVEEDLVATVNYGFDFPAIVSRNRIFATQFHPEKSGNIGLRILKNFVEIMVT
ncbi:imidazole glycerol phosphate synthase subunit HisH [Candidatus Bathyarchaeota archaeon]|nr:imidazole glycerol phosphate synthase subunit HisH [Candidatus Bathyarchaeota archaeon]